jgi:hypothetical protein
MRRGISHFHYRKPPVSLCSQFQRRHSLLRKLVEDVLRASSSFPLSVVLHRHPANFSSLQQLHASHRSASVSCNTAVTTLRSLFNDFPSVNPIARLAVILGHVATAICANGICPGHVQRLHQNLSALVAPLTRVDLKLLFTSPFIEKYMLIRDYALEEMHLRSDEVQEIIAEATMECLAIACKVRTEPMILELVAESKSRTVFSVVGEDVALGSRCAPNSGRPSRSGDNDEV